jgi:hypothetical protein
MEARIGWNVGVHDGIGRMDLFKRYTNVRDAVPGG